MCPFELAMRVAWGASHHEKLRAIKPRRGPLVGDSGPGVGRKCDGLLITSAEKQEMRAYARTTQHQSNHD